METTIERKPKNGHGEGSLRERNGKIQARVLVDGRRLTRTFANKTEARKWIRQTLSDADQGILPADGEKVKVDEFLGQWLAIKKASVKPKTYELYEYVTRLHITPTLGRLKLRDLRADHLHSLYAAKLESGLAPRTVQIAHRMLHGALKAAVQWGLLGRNVADAVIAPKPRRPEMKVWTPAEAAAFLKATADDRMGPAYVLMLYCGLRLGELLALKWDDVDLSSGRLQVRRTLQRLKRGQGLVTGEPKSAHGRRQIVLPGPAGDALRQRKVRQMEERLAAGGRWKETGYVFTTGIGTPFEPSNVDHYFAREVKRLGLPPIRVHDLRHTCATMLLSRGVHPKIVQELLGHSQISLTMDTYSHVLPTMQEEAARVMELALAVR